MFTSLVLASGALLVGVWGHALITLLVVAVIFGLCLWALDAINPREPFKKVIHIVLIVGACIFLINFLLTLTGSKLF
jgi:preprotein translocase subunit SecE